MAMGGRTEDDIQCHGARKKCPKLRKPSKNQAREPVSIVQNRKVVYLFL